MRVWYFCKLSRSFWYVSNQIFYSGSFNNFGKRFLFDCKWNSLSAKITSSKTIVCFPKHRGPRYFVSNITHRPVNALLVRMVDRAKLPRISTYRIQAMSILFALHHSLNRWPFSRNSLRIRREFFKLDDFSPSCCPIRCSARYVNTCPAVGSSGWIWF